MELSAILGWVLTHELFLVTVAFGISEILGSIPAFKSNGILSFVILTVQDFLKKRGAVDVTPND